MTFRITLHSGFAAPADALDLLWPHLDAMRSDVGFVKVGGEIRTTWAKDSPVSMESDEREQTGRLAILKIVCDVCEGAPELKSDWFAISPVR